MYPQPRERPPWSSRSCRRAADPRARHDCCPLCRWCVRCHSPLSAAWAGAWGGPQRPASPPPGKGDPAHPVVTARRNGRVEHAEPPREGRARGSGRQTGSSRCAGTTRSGTSPAGGPLSRRPPRPERCHPLGAPRRRAGLPGRCDPPVRGPGPEELEDPARLPPTGRRPPSRRPGRRHLARPNRLASMTATDSICSACRRSDQRLPGRSKHAARTRSVRPSAAGTRSSEMVGMARGAPSPADLQVVRELAAREVVVAVSQLESWRRVGLLPRQRRRGRG